LLCLGVLVACLVPSLARADVPASLAEWARKSQGRHAYGVYVKGKKVGWSIEEMKLGKRDGKAVLLSLSEQHIVTAFDGEKSVIDESSTVTYSLEGDGPIIHALARYRRDRLRQVRRVEPAGKGLVLITEQNGRKAKQPLPVLKDTLRNQRDLEAWLARPPKKGATFTKWTASWEEEEVNQKEEHIFKERKTILWGGVPTAVSVVEVRSSGAKYDAELLPDGRMLTGVLGGLWTLKLEKEATVKDLDAVVDLLTASSVFVNRDLGRAREVDHLKLKVTGLGDFRIPESHRQVVKPDRGFVTLTVRRDHRAKAPAALAEKERAAHLKATQRVQCDDAKLIVLAKRLVGPEKDPVKAATRLARWVYGYLDKSYSSTADNALAVLERQAGDCTEHTLLFVALARAVGLPAREVGGLAFVQARKPLFGWHAWAEFHDGRQWVSVDATWDQVYVDGTHIKMSEGSSDMAWTNVVGTMKMEVLAVQKRKKEMVR
jgi:hypothetical protein